MNIISRFFERTGKNVLKFFEITGQMVIFFLKIIKWIFKPPFRTKQLVTQFVKVGIETLPVALITSSFTGMIFIVQVYLALKMYTLESVSSSALALALFRELAPILVGLVMAGRVGAAMTAELGSMKVTEQIDALKTMGVEPIQYLVVPRFLASIIMMMGITVLADFIGIIGGFFVGTKVFTLNPNQFVENVKFALVTKDLYVGVIKAAVFGGFISFVGCYKGFTTTGGSEGVGKATTESVVLAMMLILISDYFLNLMLW